MVFNPFGHKDGAEERGRSGGAGGGRGGAGNIDRSQSRGRSGAEPVLPSGKAANPILHSGRGGAGNVRSPSRDPADRARVRDAEVKEHSLQEDALKNAHVLHSGRGGAGNVRSPSRDPTDRVRAEQKEHDVQEEYIKHEMAGPHASGRGGAGNFVPGHAANGSASANGSTIREDSSERGRGREDSGRGRASGVGNILRSLSRSRSRDAAAGRTSQGDSPHRTASSTATGLDSVHEHGDDASVKTNGASTIT